MYFVLYRKWRPKNFDDLTCQDYTVEILKNEIISNKISHAYLFTGCRGTGKTSCARIFSKAVNCLNLDLKTGNPCCKCQNCLNIESGSSLDISEIDAASNNGVDNIRDIKEETSFTPSVFKYKIYIIDEIHMLSTGAFNALLKILEEPPEHIIFILATTEINKIPLTIISRCQRFDFNRIGQESILNRLKYISEKENIKIDHAALNLISKVSNGSMRDALSILDQCSNFSDKNLDLNLVKNILGIPEENYIADIVNFIFKSDFKKTLDIINVLNEKSKNFVLVTDEIIEVFRQILWYKTIEKNFEGLSESIKKFVKKTELNMLIKYVDILKSSYNLISKSNNKMADFEILIIKLCNVNTDISKINIKKTEKVEKSEIHEFALWEDIIENLKLKSSTLGRALGNSKAYESEKFLLIDTNVKLAKTYLNSLEHKEIIKQAIFEITEKNYNLGPYPKKKNKIDDFLEDMKFQNVNLEII
ncbi:MAG: DNA polymerase III subunit gamma/tau [Candidatus Paraimprobicoccus trichonymphae]|uniref:DNA-directed DNA polymerase n=1 Tax=Candidatus Paraimprobicoccus trichonymphae TaxID=3033793 RepID=A0AA48I0N7_9FIRM|nr:MAG: DNA polymerase III subunit gamma/tau [Candidatus Paraimprobicoccus trichonymphae]